MRIVGAGLLAVGLHAGIGYGAHAIAKRVERETPVRLKRFLVDKQTMEDVLERIRKLRDENEEIDYLEIALQEEIEELEEIIETIPDDEYGGLEQESETEIDIGYDDSAYAALGDEGEAGDEEAPLTGNRYGVAGPADNPDPHIARQAALRDAAEFGMMGMLNSGAGGDPDAPTSPYGRDDSLGTDPLSARGNMWGDSIGESFGAGGLGLSGIGEGGGGIAEGGGGTGEGIGLGSIGTIGHGAGTGTGQGFGSGHGRLGRSHRALPPRVRTGSSNVSGKLPPEVINRIIRQSFGRFRVCYTSGLKNNPNLQGRVTVRFTIKRDGSVGSVSGGGDIPDQGVISCVTRAFHSLTFPAPDDGIVTVSYPIVFTPGDATADSAPKKKKKKKKKNRKKKKAKAVISSVSAGSLSQKKVKRILRGKRTAFARCHRGEGGGVTVQVGIDTSGNVVIGKRSKAIVSAYSNSAANCVLDAIASVSFPAPKDGATTLSFTVVLGE